MPSRDPTGRRPLPPSGFAADNRGANFKWRVGELSGNRWLPVTGSGDEAAAAVEPTDLKWVGPATAEALGDADFDAADLADKRVSCHMLVEAGVNPGVAAKIRREHSLAWSFESTDDLDRRSAQIRGLGDAEAAWVAEAAWRERSAPTPLTELDSVGEDDAAALSEAGITSVRSLATADPEHLADVLELDGDRVAAWHEAARDAADDRSLRNL